MYKQEAFALNYGFFINNCICRTFIQGVLSKQISIEVAAFEREEKAARCNVARVGADNRIRKKVRVELLDSHNTNIVYCVCAVGKVKYVEMTSGVVVMASGVEPRQRKNASGFSTQGVLNILSA